MATASPIYSSGGLAASPPLLRRISSDVTSPDKKEIEKFARFFTLKAVQLIVQSRLGERQCTPCKVDPVSSDWFNLSIIDIPEVNSEVKKHLISPPYVGPDLPPAVVEISLRTSEGDTMVLELWTISCSENAEPPSTNPSAVYNRMVILLKSILSVTRAVPAYKLARRQGSDTFIICYRVYAGQQSSVILGEGAKLHRIGQVATSLGTISATVEYRTHLALSPHKAETPILIKSDHFEPESSPKACRQAANVQKSDSPLSLRCCAFACDVALPVTTVPDLPLVDIISQEIEETKRISMDKALERKRTAESSMAKSPPVTAAREPKSAQGSNQSLQHVGDDFVLIDMKLPFADTDPQGADIGSFYKQCQAAPPLSIFEHEPTFQEQISDLALQLEDFELRSKDFDDLVRSLCSDTELE